MCLKDKYFPVEYMYRNFSLEWKREKWIFKNENSFININSKNSLFSLEKKLRDRYPADFFPNFHITLKSRFLFSHDYIWNPFAYVDFYQPQNAKGGSQTATSVE